MSKSRHWFGFDTQKLSSFPDGFAYSNSTANFYSLFRLLSTIISLMIWNLSKTTKIFQSIHLETGVAWNDSDFGYPNESPWIDFERSSLFQSILIINLTGGKENHRCVSSSLPLGATWQKFSGYSHKSQSLLSGLSLSSAFKKRRRCQSNSLQPDKEWMENAFRREARQENEAGSRIC